MLLVKSKSNTLLVNIKLIETHIISSKRYKVTKNNMTQTTKHIFKFSRIAKSYPSKNLCTKGLQRKKSLELHQPLDLNTGMPFWAMGSINSPYLWQYWFVEISMSNFFLNHFMSSNLDMKLFMMQIPYFCGNLKSPQKRLQIFWTFWHVCQEHCSQLTSQKDGLINHYSELCMKCKICDQSHLSHISCYLSHIRHYGWAKKVLGKPST